MLAAAAFVVSALLASGDAAGASNVQRCEGRSYELPARTVIVCSATWRFVGPCDGGDLWDRWAVSDHAGADGAFVRPWHDERIMVVGYEMTKATGEPHSYFMVGSGIIADGFLWMPSERNNARVLFPAGTGHPWPSKQESEAQRRAVNDVIDIHGSCRPTLFTGAARSAVRWMQRLAGVAEIKPARPAVVFLTIYYTPWPGAVE
jgi:hypothetical protein